MDPKEIDALVRFHQDGLDQYRQHISPSAQYLEEQTIKALKLLKAVVEHAPNALKAGLEHLEEDLNKR